MTPHLFTPLALGPVAVPNRIAVAPMCQYSAADGSALDWHLQHLMTLAMSGAGLVMIEATAVERRGRITHGCLGLYSDDNERALGRVLAAARAVALPGTTFGIQLSHAGRKGSAQRPWEGGKALGADDDPWNTLAPSALPFDDGWHLPEPVDETDILRVRDAFVAATARAARLGIDVIELHMAHGYLMHQFQSPLSNRREDSWGGDAVGRSRFSLSVAQAVREAAPEIAVGARITGTDWTEDGITPDAAAGFASALKELGLDFACVTSGGVALKAKIPLGPGYQVALAAKVRRESGIVTRAVGLIADPHQAEAILSRSEADQVALARAFLDNPRWGWHAAEALGVELAYPPQYARAKAGVWPGAAIARTDRESAPERLRA